MKLITSDMLLNDVTSAEQFRVVSPRGTDWKLENTP